MLSLLAMNIVVLQTALRLTRFSCWVYWPWTSWCCRPHCV